MLAIYQRMAELWTIRKQRELTVQENGELELCLTANANIVWSKIKLENLSFFASATNDYEWLHEICRQLERLEANPSDAGKTKDG